MSPDVSSVMTDALIADDDVEVLDDVVFTEDEEAALLVALLRWRGPKV